MKNFFINFIPSLIEDLFVIVSVLLSVAFITLLERKILAVIQRRQGPNVIGVFGLLQPLADGFKLLVKESIYPSNANKLLFHLAPIISFNVSLLAWGVIPFSQSAIIADINLGIIYILSVSSLGVYGVIISGWSSNSKYSFLGALRSSAQMISYELSMGFSILSVIVCAGSLNINLIIDAQRKIWFCFPLFIPFLIFFISSLAETNRHPFDLPEAESELVSGYNVEYSAMGFALFSLAEYSNILMMCSLNSILFFGGWHAPFSFLDFLPGSLWLAIKIVFFAILFVYIRAILPRYRYDQLMQLGWKILLPISFGYLFFTIGVIEAFSMYSY
jgi:NADH-quinone oxidoreductase subunit H